MNQPAPQQPAPQAAPQQQPAAPPSTAGSSGGDSGSYDVHGCALKAQQALEKLATELAHAGAPQNVTGTVGKMADAVAQIVQMAGKSAAPQPAPQPQKHTMSSAANSLVADVAARKAQGG